jgi:hypothetical protein
MFAMWLLECLAEQQAASHGQLERAAKLAGASNAIRETTDLAATPIGTRRWEQRLWSHLTALLEAAPDQERFTAAKAEGRNMTVARAVAYALTDEPPSTRTTAR